MGLHSSVIKINITMILQMCVCDIRIIPSSFSLSLSHTHTHTHTQYVKVKHCTIALISHASKVMIKILQARLQQYGNHELPDVQAGFRKGRGTRDQIANIR